MWPFKNKFEKISRGDVVDCIINIEKRQQEEINSVTERNKEIDKLLLEGRRSKSRDMQLALAKRINMLKAENQKVAMRIQYLNGNLQALNQLKNAIDDKDFLTNNSNLPLNKLLTDTNALRKFLVGVNSKKMVNEEKLSSTLDIFENVEESYEANEKIYGTSQQDDQLLAMFEIQNSDDDAEMFGDGTADESSSVAVDKQTLQ